jgi:hypothetical protein
MGDGLRRAAGRLAVIAVTGLGLGIVVGGAAGRTAMYLPARASPEAHGVVSDDGFVMGRFTLGGTLNLLLVGAGLGVVGAAIYAGVRWLQPERLGLRVVATAVCAGVGVGALIVHRDGVDFTVLDAGPATALFVVIPALYGGLLAGLVETFLERRPDGFVSPVWRWCGLLPFVVVPVLPVFALVWWGGRRLDGTVLEEKLRGSRARWAGRGVASAALLLLARDLLLDAAALT